MIETMDGLRRAPAACFSPLVHMSSTPFVTFVQRAFRISGSAQFGLVLRLLVAMAWALGWAAVWLSVLSGTSVVAQFAIPERYDGFVYNGKQDPVMRGPVLWEVFVDPLCIDCKNAWPAVKQVADHYGSLLVVIVHPFPAPFHHNAFFACRALHVAQRTNASLVYPLLELIFSNQEAFLNPSTNHETPAHVVSRLISLAADLGLSANSFEAGFNDSATDLATRISFKYGCSRGVVGTPSYLVNGVAVVGADESWSVDEWAKIFEPLVKASGLGMIYPSS